MAHASKNRNFLIGLFGFFFVLFLAITFKMQNHSTSAQRTLKTGQAIQVSTGSLFLSPVPAPNLSFINAQGQRWTCPDDLKTWSVFFFGYAQCPAFCPSILQQMDQIARIVPKGAVDFYFVSIDPERDTPESLSLFLKKYHSPIIGLTGSEISMRSLADFFKLHVEHATQKEEHIEHAAVLAILDPQGYACGILSDLTVPTRVAADLRHLMTIKMVHDVPQQ